MLTINEYECPRVENIDWTKVQCGRHQESILETYKYHYSNKQPLVVDLGVCKVKNWTCINKGERNIYKLIIIPGDLTNLYKHLIDKIPPSCHPKSVQKLSYINTTQFGDPFDNIMFQYMHRSYNVSRHYKAPNEMDVHAVISVKSLIITGDHCMIIAAFVRGVLIDPDSELMKHTG